VKNRKIYSTKNIMIFITVFCLILIIYSWENNREANAIEQTISYVIIPVQNGVNEVGDWIYSKYDFLRNLNDLEKMNTELKQELDQLQYENHILEQNKIELERLRKLYELDKRYADYPKIGAQVIGKDPSNWYNTLIINKGTDDGLKENMVVLAGNGLVGHITKVGANFATVQTIINDNVNVSGKIMRTSDLCIVKGDQTLVSEEAFARVEYILDSANIVKGDEVVTSHLGGIYPPGIMIGTIKEIEDDPHQMTKKAILEPVVDFKHIEEVLVINQVWNEGIIEEDGLE